MYLVNSSLPQGKLKYNVL